MATNRASAFLSPKLRYAQHSPPHDQQGGLSRCAEEEKPAGSPAHPPPDAMNPAAKFGGWQVIKPPSTRGGEIPWTSPQTPWQCPRPLQPLTGLGGEPLSPRPGLAISAALCSCRGFEKTCRTMPSRRGGCEPAQNRGSLPASDTGRLQASAPRRRPDDPPPQPKTNSRAKPILLLFCLDTNKFSLTYILGSNIGSYIST